MQPYQNFSYQPSVNPYQNNFNQPAPAQMYTDRMNQLQQYQQNLAGAQMSLPSQQAQSQGIIGRVVNDFNEITANDVPMNGSAAFFPKADGSELQVRSWASNGAIQTVAYRPVIPKNTEQGTNIPQNDFTALNEDVKALREDIKNMRSMIEKSMTGTTKTTTRAKKQDASNE